MGKTIIRGLLPNTTYLFQVLAINIYGVRSDTAVVTYYTTQSDSTAPAMPASVTVTVQGRHIHVEVPKQTEVDFAGFEFYASISTGFTPSDSTLKQKGDSTTCEFMGTADAQTWYIKVCSYDTSLNKSSYTTQVSAVTATYDAYDTTAPAVPVGLALSTNTYTEADGTKHAYILADCTDNTESDFSHYIWRIKAGAGDYTYVTGTNVSQNLFQRLIGGVTYSIGVAGEDRSGNKSAFSTDVTLAAAVDCISVTKLVAGTITSQSITLAVTVGGDDVDVKLQAGKTDFAQATAGLILGIDDSDSDRAKLELYYDANNYFTWDGLKLLVKAANFTLDTSGNITATNVTLTGSITATSGTIAGFTVDSTEGLYAGAGATRVQMKPGAGMWCGATAIGDAPFSATNAGVIKATSGTIGGWTLASDSLTGGNATLHNTGYLNLGTSNDIVKLSAVDATYRIWVGHATAASAPFSVTKAGVLKATTGTIEGLLQVGTSDPHLHIDGTNALIESSNYASGSAGWQVTKDGNAEFNNIEARGAFRCAVFTYNSIQAFNGANYVVPVAGKLYASCTSVDSPTTFNVDIEDSDGLTHVQCGALWENTDIIRIKEPIGVGVQDLWGTIAAPTDMTTYWRLTVTKTSPGAGTNYTFTKGGAVLNYKHGVDVYGSILVSASETYSPRMSLYTHPATPWTGLTERLRVGNLNGYLGYVTDLYGIGIGGSAAGQGNLVHDPTNGLRLRSGTTDKIVLDNSGNVTLTGTVTATAGAIGGFTLSSTALYAGTTTTRIQLDTTSGIHLGATAFADAPFRVSLAGALTATSATLSGAISASTIDIGGDDATSFHVDVNGGIWSGASIANKATAPFRVSNAGALVATSATIGGWTVNATSIYTGTEDHSGYTANAGDITIYSDGVDASIHAKNFYIDTSGNLTATSVTVSGTLTTSAGSDISATYITGSIVAAQIGSVNASAITGTIVSSQIASVAATTITGTLISSQIASVAATTITGTITSTQIGSVNAATITIGLIGSSQINSITAAQLTTGTITSKIITLGYTGADDVRIQANRTDFGQTTAGFVLGIDATDGLAKFEIGDANYYWKWNGTDIQQRTRMYDAQSNLISGSGGLILGQLHQGLVITTGQWGLTSVITCEKAVLLNPTTGEAYLGNSLSFTGNLGTTSGINGLDTGTWADNSWYYIWLVSNGQSGAANTGMLYSLEGEGSLPSTSRFSWSYCLLVGAVKTVSTSVQWARNTAYYIGDLVYPLTSTGYYYYCSAKGTSGVVGPGPNAISTVTLNAGGSGYTSFDILTVVQSGASQGKVWVDSVDEFGTILAMSLYQGGYTYSVANGLSVTGGTGTNCTVNVTGIASWTQVIGNTATDGGVTWICVKQLWMQHQVGKLVINYGWGSQDFGSNQATWAALSWPIGTITYVPPLMKRKNLNIEIRETGSYQGTLWFAEDSNGYLKYGEITTGDYDFDEDNKNTNSSIIPIISDTIYYRAYRSGGTIKLFILGWEYI